MKASSITPQHPVYAVVVTVALLLGGIAALNWSTSAARDTTTATLAGHGRGPQATNGGDTMAKSGYVITGCLHGLSSTTRATVPSCHAVLADNRTIDETRSTTITYSSGDGAYWLAIQTSRHARLDGWTAVPGSPYLWQRNDTQILPSNTFAPTLPDGSMLVARVTVADGAITQVLDLRDDNPYTDAARLDSPLFGAVNDCGTTDNREALQAAINNAAARRVTLELPTGCFSYSGVLYLHYDKVRNPNYPYFTERPGWAAGLPQDGRLTIKGAGSLGGGFDTQSQRADYGTVLISTDPVGPAVSVVDVSPMTISALQSVRLQDLTVTANNSTWIVNIDGGSAGVGIDRVSMRQDNPNGGCLRVEDTYENQFSDIFCDGPNSNGTPTQDMGTGIGISIVHPDSNGGQIVFTNVTSRQFGTCWQIGAPLDAAGNPRNLASVTLIASESSQCRIGVDVGGNVRGLALQNFHNEDAREAGVWIRNDARQVSIFGGIFASGHMNPDGALVWLGDATQQGPKAGFNGVVIEGAQFMMTKSATAIRMETTSSGSAVTVGTNTFDGGPSGRAPKGIGIDCTGGPHNSSQLEIAPQSFPVGIDGERTKGCDVSQH